MATEPLFLRACFGQPTERTPVWLMRQAGRYMAEYRAVRSKVDFWTLCQTPELACEVTMQPIDAFGLDAAIVFSDLLISLPPLGFPVHFTKGHGPVVEGPVVKASDVDRMQPFDVGEALGYVAEAVKLIVAALPADVPLIGFAGAPFTLASYLLEGGSSKQYIKTKAFLYTEPAAAERLFDRLCEITIDLLNLQIDAGARAVQIFDSWAGCLDPEDFDRWSGRYLRRIADGVRRPGVPVIAFPKGTGTYLDRVAATGADVVGFDWTLPYRRARALVGAKTALQGNLDPIRLLGPFETAVAPAVDALLDAAGDGTGHVFNLGHGIHQHTPPDTVARLVEHVRVESAKRRGRDA
ncbi:MAG: uroporphyrinogen decarboxylase [Myxococcales bacterium]|nr:uroporphyrinogen decarboxylase [Myxococcales bacterium]